MMSVATIGCVFFLLPIWSFAYCRVHMMHGIGRDYYILQQYSREGFAFFFVQEGVHVDCNVGVIVMEFDNRGHGHLLS